MNTRFAKSALAAALALMAASTVTLSTAEAGPGWKPVPVKPIGLKPGLIKPGPKVIHPVGFRHRDRLGWGVAAGVIGGLAVGAMIASSQNAAAQPVYEDEPQPRRVCSVVERVNSWGEVIGTRRVCRVVY
jgi:hypothetical protein